MYKLTTQSWQLAVPSLFKRSAIGSALIALGFMTGCASSQSTVGVSKSKQIVYLEADGQDSLQDLLSATDMRAVEGDRLLILKHGDVWKRMSVGYKMDTNQSSPRIDAQRSWFISRQPYIDRLSARASRYLYHTVKEAERRGLPTELALLPIIESSYDPAATSSAAAAGLWQFIPSTGRIYGLKQSGNYDGRRDVVESTRAAYEFLGSLYNQFGSWELALAAYNAGPGRIQQAINRNKAAGLPTDYWSLKLPQETMYYVPRFLAVAQIVKNPHQYGVTLPPIANRPHFREVSVGTANLNDISALTGLSRAELYSLNPGHRGDYIDVSSPQKILIPADVNPSIDAKLKKLAGGASTTLLAASKPVTSQKVTDTVSTTVVSSKTTPPPLQAAVTSKSTTSTASTTVSKSDNSRLSVTPKGSIALAAFANSTDIPSAPRIPVAVTQATNIRPVNIEPPISAIEREKIVTALKAEESLKAQDTAKSVDDILKPVASKEEQAQVVAELKRLAPEGTEIVDPYDGKIKITAIQTSLSVAEQEGKTLTKGFSYPKSVAENTKPEADEIKRNVGKNYVKTDSDIVVIAPKGKRSTYRVVSGDTLVLIAQKNGVNWRDVAQWNQIDPKATLYTGATIYLYDAKPLEEPKLVSQPESYIVKVNDSLTSVAAQFGLSVKQLADLNDLTTTSNLRVGQKLTLKDLGSKRTTSTSTAPVKIKTQSYTVKRGEYLKLIADRYALSNQELADLTPGLTSGSHLMAGQKINVPLNEAASNNKEDAVNTKSELVATKPSYKVENYIVQRGDTLYSIASESKISLAELANLNNMATTKGLQAGQTLKVPSGSNVPETYTVQSGDSLTAISSKFNLEIGYLTNINGISRNTNLRVGQKLKLTGDEPKATTKASSKVETTSSKKLESYVVQSGDTLSSVARKFDLNLAELAELNDLGTNTGLRVGQRLKIEEDRTSNKQAEKSSSGAVKKLAISSKNTEKYTVKTGESLHVIASRVGMSVSELAAINDLSPKAGLRVGQSINVPKLVVSYTVKRGDTLIGLANRYGTDTKTLAEMNDMQPSAALRIGQVIKVPNM